MRKKSGGPVGHLSLPALDGSEFELGRLEGRRFMLAFFRFAACPFCNLRVHELTERYAELECRLEVVAVFDSPLANLQRHARRHHAPFPILADEANLYYRAFGIERSVSGLARAALLRFPAALHGVLVKGYLPTSFQGHVLTLPAEFLIDEHGMIQRAYYGRDSGDHLPFEDIKAFAFAGPALNVVPGGAMP